MSTNTKRSSVVTPTERNAPRTDLDTQHKHGRPQDPRTVPLFVRAIALLPALVATVALYVFLIVSPQGHTPLNEFLAGFARGNAAIWPMQLVWYTNAAAIVGLALWPIHRATLLICPLAAAYFAWIGIAYFGVLFSATHVAWVSGLWAAAFILEGILFLVAGLVRCDLVFAPHWDLASVLGAVFISYALIAYPLIGLFAGQPLGSLPMFGLAPCPTTMFAFGLLLWARPPVPSYLLLIPMA